MPRIALRALLDDAAEHNYAIPAFNANTLEQCHAIMRAAQEEDAPAIIQVTKPAWDHLGRALFPHIIEGLHASYPRLPMCVHLDHGFDSAICSAAMHAGFTSVMIDGSLTPDLSNPSEFEDNVRITTDVVLRARPEGVSVEGALGVVGSLASCLGILEDGEATTDVFPRSAFVTDPCRAAEFVDRTGIDALAIAIGTTHGVAKFATAPKDEDLELRVMEAIHLRLPNMHLVMHGCSSLPSELQDIVNKFGGRIRPSWGIPTDVLKLGIEHGLRKINIDTDNRLAMTAGIRRYLAEFPEDIDPRHYLKAGMTQMINLCRQRYQDFGTSGRATHILIKASRYIASA